MSAKKRPIQRSLVIGSALFILLLCVLLTVQSYLQFSVALYKQCQRRLTSVIDYVDRNLDKEDLNNCILYRKTSVKYIEAQAMLNGMVDTFDLAYLYICFPSGNAMINVAYSKISLAPEARRSGTGERRTCPFSMPPPAIPRRDWPPIRRPGGTGTSAFSANPPITANATRAACP